jgi:hypothetical protein
MTGGQRRSLGVQVEFAAAEALEQADPELVALAADGLRAAAEADLGGRVPRSVAYVRRLQELTVERPELGIAVARALGLEHIVEDLLEGMAVEGVPGIGPDGTVLPPTRRHKARLCGKWILGISTLVLFVEAIIAYGLASAVIYVWTSVGLGLFFVGAYLVFMIRE